MHDATLRDTATRHLHPFEVWSVDTLAPSHPGDVMD